MAKRPTMLKSVGIIEKDNPMKEELLKAVADLREFDHCAIGEEGVQKFAERFGCHVRSETLVADLGPDNPKGLTIAGGAKTMVGLAAEDLADQIVRAYKLTPSIAMGRGFRLRQNCDILESYFAALPDGPAEFGSTGRFETVTKR